MPNIGLPEILLIALVIVLLFGATRLPKLAKGMGQALNEFRKAQKQADSEDEAEKETDMGDEGKREKKKEEG